MFFMKKMPAILIALNSDSLKDQFSFDKQIEYAPVVKEISAGNNKISYSFPPRSFTQIKISIKKN